jgi:hypothetical protein
MVRHETGYRGKDDAAKGRRQRYLHHVVGGKTLSRENKDQDRNDDDAAADPQKACNYSDNDPQRRINDPFQHDLISRRKPDFLES